LAVNKHGSLLRSNLIPFGTVLASWQRVFDSYDLSRDDEEYLIPTNVAETTPGQINCAACLLTAASVYLNSPPEVPKNWQQNNPNLND
jgi:hypothetical protein